MVDAYAAHGIDLVIDPNHTAIAGKSVMVFSPEGDIHLCSDGSPDVYSLQAQYFHPTSNHQWHYAVFGDYIASELDERCQPSLLNGIAEINGDNFIVAFSPLRRLGLTPIRVGAVFMHELGHNLGLRHGGNVDQNFKPNYLSVMNYSFIYGGIPYAASLGSTSIAGRRLDYSGAALPTLDESHLNEIVGVGAGSTDITFFDTPNGFGLGAASGPIDWNLDGSIENDITVNLDTSADCFPPAVYPQCLNSYEQMTGFDDWGEIRGYLDGTLVHEPKTIVGENRANEPMVIGVTPSSGRATGGTAVTITGTHFNKATQVVFGAAGQANFTIINDKTIVAVAPLANLAGYVTDVTVVLGQDPSPGNESDQFTYTGVLPIITGLNPSSGPAGTVITVNGSNFTGSQAVTFGENSALWFTVVDDHTITAQSPGCCFLFGAYHIGVFNAYGANVLAPNDVFLFTPPPPPPAVTSVSPTSGPAAGSTPITIRGSGFSGATSVSVGPYGIASFTVIDDTTITAVTNPAGALGPGTFDVTVNNAGGASGINFNDGFTYF